jgi:hypothetical protein
MKGQITTELFHKILFHGEWIPEDVDLKELLSNVKTLKEDAKRDMLEQQSQNANVAGNTERQTPPANTNRAASAVSV